MEISQFARQVLLGTRMSDKLHRPEQLTDDKPRALCQIPSRPGRPKGLELVEKKLPGAAFPSFAALAKPQARGLAFHFFANHELLALELMAVALLRFHDAPAAFRRQVAHAMLEEQEHLSAYLAHMPGYGVGFGDVTVSPFFWNALANMASPMEYIAGMSLTFEQANLDFAARFRDAFAAVEDQVGAAVLQKVLDDEIGHVRLGVQWMRRLGDPHKTDFERHRDALVWPLHMARAKGEKTPLVEVRQRAGLSMDYIDALSCVRASKGRAPCLWSFYPGYERELSGGHSKIDRVVESDLGFLLSYLATPGDLVGLTKLPSVAYLKAMQALDFGDVELLEVPAWPQPWSAQSIGAQKLAGLESWGPSQRAGQVFGELVQRSVKPLPSSVALDASARLSSKVHAGELEREFVQSSPERARMLSLGQKVENLEALEACLGQSSDQVCVMKAPLGSAGQQQQRVLDGCMTVAQLGWAKKILARQGALRVEPWSTRVLDLSARFSALEGGKRRLTGLTRMLCDERGAFVGHVLAPLGAGLDPEFISFLYDKGQRPRWLAGLYEGLCRWIFEQEAYRAYQGPLGIDGMVIREQGLLRLRPMLEINARWTMGHVADGLSRRVLRSACGIWLHLGLGDLRAAGFSDFGDLARALPTQVELQGRCIAKGRVWTSDPSQAQALATLLLVGRSPQEALERLGPLASRMQSRICRGSGDAWSR